MKSGKVGKHIWVKARKIKQVTGWSDKNMTEARSKNWITWRFTPENKFEYDLASVHILFLKESAPPTEMQPIKRKPL